MVYFRYIIILIECLFFIGLNFFYKKQKFSMIQVQNYIWFLAYFLYLINFFDYYAISETVCVMTFIYIAVVNFSYLIGKIPKLEFNDKNLNTLEKSILSKKIEKRCLFVSVAIWIISIPLLQKSIPILLNKGMLVMRWILYGDDPFYSGFEMCIVDYIIRPLATVTIIYFAEQITVKGATKKMAICTILNSVLLVFLTSGRALLEKLIIYSTLAILVAYGINLKKIFTRFKKYILPLVLMFIIVLCISSQRISRNNGIIKEGLIYMFSSMPYLSALIKNNLAKPMVTYGLNTFSFIIDPILLGLRFFGIKIENEFLLSKVTGNNIYIGKSQKMNAVGSTLLPFYLDFGYIGVILFSFIIAKFVKLVENKFAQKYDRINQNIYLYFVEFF